MPDRSIPFYNLILKCRDYQPKAAVLPEGFSITPYRRGDERAWAELEFAAGDFDSVEQAEAYFTAAYMEDLTVCEKRARFLRGRDGNVVGSCIAWKDRQGDGWVPSLHWLIVDEPHRRRGLGRALCQAVMDIFWENGEFPVYIHTQPWSWQAVFLYGSMGFRIQRTDTFSHYTNQYGQAMAALKAALPEEQYQYLAKLTEDF